jgi:hypothetical protein
MGPPIRFSFTFGCNTAANVFQPQYPRLVLGVDCGTWAESLGINIPLPAGSWTYDAKKLEYSFNFKVDKATNNNLAMKGSCLLLQLAFKEDANRVATARFKLV